MSKKKECMYSTFDAELPVRDREGTRKQVITIHAIDWKDAKRIAKQISPNLKVTGILAGYVDDETGEYTKYVQLDKKAFRDCQKTNK